MGNFINNLGNDQTDMKSHYLIKVCFITIDIQPLPHLHHLLNANHDQLNIS